MESAIVGPTFVQKADEEQADLVAVLQMARGKKESAIVDPTLERFGEEHGVKLMKHSVTDGERMLRPLNDLQTPQEGCDYRHTDFVELTAPLLKSSVLKHILVDCKQCIHEQSDWGLDRMWCKYVYERSGQGCGLVDKTPMIHLDTTTAVVSSAFHEAVNDVKAHYKRYWTSVKALDCVQGDQEH